MIIHVVGYYYRILKSITMDLSLLFILMFCFLLCYFLEIKRRLFIAFYPPTDSKIKRKNIIIEIYHKIFINEEQNNWTRLLPIAEFVYNNTKNTSTSHILFELQCGFYSESCFKKVSTLILDYI